MHKFLLENIGFGNSGNLILKAKCEGIFILKNNWRGLVSQELENRLDRFENLFFLNKIRENQNPNMNFRY